MNKLISFILFIAFACVLFKANDLLLLYSLNGDFPWILETGKQIVQNHFIPKHDLYSWTNFQKEWLVYQWLFEVISYFLVNSFGLKILIKIYVLLTLLIYVLVPAFIQRKQGVSLIYSLAVSSIAVYAATCNLAWRPLIFTSLFLLVQTYLLQRFKTTKNWKKYLFIFFVIYVLWANLHMGVLLGLVSLSLFAFGDFLESKKIWPKQNKIQNFSLKKYQFVLITSLVASFINPYCYKIYSYLFDLSSKSYLNSMINELMTPGFHRTAPLLFLILFTIFLLIPRKYYSAGIWLNTFLFSMPTFYSGRFIVWSCLFLIISLPLALNNFFNELKQTTLLQIFGNKFFLTKKSILLLSILIFSFVSFGKANDLGECRYLWKAINFYNQQKPPSSKFLLNDDMVGSCLIFKDPNTKVFIDTRFDFFGENFVKAWREEFLFGKNLFSYLDYWKPDFIFLQKKWVVINQLKTLDNMKVIYEDEYAIIFEVQK